MERPRIWVVSPQIHRWGGTERCVAEQLRRWRGRFDIRVYSQEADPAATEGLDVRPVPRIPGPHVVRWIGWYAWNRLIRRRDARREGPPDLVYSPGVNGRDADVMTVHIVFGKFWREAGRRELANLGRPRFMARAAHRTVYWALLRWLEGRLYRGPATLAAISGSDAAELERRFDRPAGSVPVIPHGIDASHFSPRGRSARREVARRRLGVEGHRVALLVGNDVYKKGVDVALRALPGLPADVVLAIAGRLVATEVLETASGLGVTDRVHLWPHTTDVLDYYAAADVLIAPSREDAFGLPPLEAAATALPVVVSARAGVAEHLIDGVHALVLPDPEDVPGLRRRLCAVLKDQGLADRLSRQGRARAEELSWDENAGATAAWLEREAATPRVLVLAPDPAGVGGIERATRTLLSALADLIGPERVGVLPLRHRRELDSLNCRVLRRGRPAGAEGGRVGMWHRVTYLLDCLRLSRRWHRRLVLVAGHPHLAPVAWLCHLVSGAPYAVWSHGYEGWARGRWSVRAAVRRADVVFFHSEFSARLTRKAMGLPVESVRIVPHCLPPDLIDVEVRHGPREPIVLTVARLDPRNAYKGVDTLLRGWSRVRDRIPEARLVVVGDGPDRPPLEGLARELGLEGSVRFAGRVSDAELAGLYGSSALFALPGRVLPGSRPAGEGFGIVLLEAAAAGLPVVAGKAGPSPEIVADGETGILVDPWDSIAVADAIINLLENPDVARRMGRAGRSRVREHYSYEGFRERVATLLDDLARRRSDLRHDLRAGLWDELTRRPA